MGWRTKTEGTSITQPTVKSWGGVLEVSCVAHFLPPWFRNYGKRVVKTPKLYFYDAALAGPMGEPLLEAGLSLKQ